MSIPQIVHYCWFGGAHLPTKLQMYVNDWKSKLSEYKIIKWDETNCDLNHCGFLRDAVSKRKWAFVADYIRLQVLYAYGGVYLDTDVEVLRAFDDLLDKSMVLGFETGTEVNGAVIFSEKGHPLIAEMLALYESRICEGQSIVEKLIPIPYILTSILKHHGIRCDGSSQLLENGIQIFSRDYFYPVSYIGEKTHLTKNSYTIHHYAGSWSSPVTRIHVFLRKNFHINIAPITQRMAKIKRMLKRL